MNFNHVPSKLPMPLDLANACVAQNEDDEDVQPKKKQKGAQSQSVPMPAPAAPSNTSQLSHKKSSPKAMLKESARASELQGRSLVQCRTFVLNNEARSVKGNQVKYGPAAGLTPAQQQQVNQHFGGQNCMARLTQYDTRHETYVHAAQAAGRPLTAEEERVNNNLAQGLHGRSANTDRASINHVIASGTGQNLLNHMTLQFNEIAPDPTDSDSVRRAVANQAAAVGRAQGMSRAIINEEAQVDHLERRREVMGNTINAFENGDMESYRFVMRETYDSTGNLRVGHGTANTRVSTGFDMPLDQHLDATERGVRLFNTLDVYGHDTLPEEAFTKEADNGNVLSSSAPKDAERKAP